MSEGVPSRITRLNQLLLGKTPGRKVPLLDKETLLDAFMVLYNECNTEQMTKDKNIATYVKKFKPLICELEKLRLKKSDFEIRKTIGRGHFGEVHVVREKVTGNVYAMKVLKKAATLTQDNVAFFEEERDIMAFANNPWITSLQYAFQDFESLYFVMDFHPGGDLLSLLAKYDDVFEEDVSKFYLAEMIMAIHAVHALGYVHRDVKPENVLIDRTGHVKLADFGSSARLSSAKTVVSKMPVGTPEYIAPEVLMSMDGGGGGGKYGIECDWWSLGVVAYEMMIGNTPFQADSVVVVYSQIMNFKNSLVFPDDEPLTDNAKHLIRSLLTDQGNRIKYEELAQHPFFSGIDWTTLQNDVPPYVPNIQREDDTSNFDDFETENSGPRLEDFMEQKKGFVGKDLPFIGFTFTKQLTLASLTETGDDPAGNPIKKTMSVKRDAVKDNSSVQLANMKTDFEKEQKKNKELKLQIEEKMKNLSKIVQERDSLASEKLIFDTEKQDFERRLNTEKTNREKLDKEVQSLRKEIEEGSNKAKEMQNDQWKSKYEEQEALMQQLQLDKTTVSNKLQHVEDDLKDHKQQLEDSKSRTNELQAKLTKANKDHKSDVSELQLNIEKINADNETRIKQIQEKLNQESTSLQEISEKLRDTEKEKEDMQLKINELKTFEELYKDKDSEKSTSGESSEEFENVQKELAEKKAECKKLEKDIKKVSAELESANTRYDHLVEFGEDLKAQVERKIERLKRENESLKTERKSSSEEYQKLKEQIDEYKNEINEKDMKISSLQVSCDSFEKQLNNIMNKEMSDEDGNEKIEEERFQLTRQLSTVSSEKLKLESETIKLANDLLDTQKEMQLYKDRLEEVQKQFDEASEISESTITKLNREISKASDETSKYHKELMDSQKSFEELELKFTELTEESGKILVSTDRIKELEAEVKISNVSVENLKADKKALEQKYQQSYDDLGKIRKEKQQVEDQLSEKERQADRNENTINMLKQTCTMLEGQVEELEIMNDEYQDRESQWNLTKRHQYQAQERLEQQYNEALASLEHQRLIKNKAEEKLRELEDNISSSRQNNDKRIEELEQLNVTQEDQIKEINASLSTLTKKDGLNAVTIKNLEKKLSSATEEKDRLLSEVSHLQELSSQQSSSNFQLTVEIESLKENLDETVTEKESLQNQIERTAFTHAEEKIKMDATLSQQIKLIEFLQKKVMGDDSKNFQPNKKKFNFGGKQKQQESVTAQPDLRKTRDLEKAIEKEKNNALQCHLQLQRAREELTNLRNENTLLKSQLKNISNPTTPQPHLKQPNILKTPSTVSVASSISMNRSHESPPTSVADIYQMAENEVRGVNNKPFEVPKDDSPHNMQTSLNMRPGKCPVCLNSLAFAKQVSRCTECNLVCHLTCVQSLPNNCGIVEVTSPLASNRSSAALDDGTVVVEDSEGLKLPKIEGWLKYPRKCGGKQNWERKWVVLQDMKLSIYENENTIGSREKRDKLKDKPNDRHAIRQNQHKFNSVSYYHSSETLKEDGYSSLPRRIKQQYGSLMRSYSALTRSSSMQSVHRFFTRLNFSNAMEFDPFDEIGDLNINEGELNIHPSIPASELIWSSPSDIQYVFSIELLPYTLGWPRRTLYFLAPTFADKQKWVRSLELIGEEVKKSTHRQGHGMADEVILTLDKSPLVLNCAALLNETGAILGCEDGLYVVSFKVGTQQNKPVHIVGVGTVYQLQIVKGLGIAVLIAGKERELCYIDIFDLESRLKQLQSGAGISAITSHQIEKVKGCHLFIIEQIDNVYHACAATSKKINILKFQSNSMNFSLKKEVDTNEPATCLLFTSNSAIFGTSKFYTVDLKNYQKRDLLDASDTSLAFAVFGTSQTQSFPIAVFNIGEGKSRDEYLLCYNQFGIFVDWQGRRSRKGDLKWSRLPLAFDYRAPHLYISHFSSIEICEIPGDVKSDISTIPRRFVDVPDPSFVGVGLQSRTVLFSSLQKQRLELISYQALITIPLSRNASTASAMSLASHTSSSSGFDSIPSTILETSALRSEADIHRASSNASMCSDEETSYAIAKDGNTPRNKRKDQVRNQDSKDKNRISFRFFKQNRKSQNLDS